MFRLLTFLSMPVGDRNLMTRAVVLLWIVRMGLWFLPFQTLQDLLRSKNRIPAGDVTNELASVRKITHSVRRMSRYVPAATCLTQSLVTLKMLDDAGLPASLRIGVAKSNSGELEAHAWVERKGRVIIGGRHKDLKRFTVLHTVKGT